MDTPTPDTRPSPVGGGDTQGGSAEGDPTLHAAPDSHDLPRWARALAGAMALAASLAVFGLYLQPEFLVSLADRMWSCF